MCCICLWLMLEAPRAKTCCGPWRLLLLDAEATLPTVVMGAQSWTESTAVLKNLKRIAAEMSPIPPPTWLGNITQIWASNVQLLGYHEIRVIFSMMPHSTYEGRTLSIFFSAINTSWRRSWNHAVGCGTNPSDLGCGCSCEVSVWMNFRLGTGGRQLVRLHADIDATLGSSAFRSTVWTR